MFNKVEESRIFREIYFIGFSNGVDMESVFFCLKIWMDIYVGGVG